MDGQMLLGAAGIFLLRVTDVSIGTVRVIYTIRGRRLLAASIGFVEAMIFILAITTVFRHLDNWANMVGYALGFAAGTALGITLERWIAAGHFLARIISRENSTQITEALRAEKFGVTAVTGEGGDARRSILFVVANRRRSRRFLELIKSVDSSAFVTIDSVTRAMGGYLPHAAPAASLRK
jgi:uncharacterized protein YebE (UPF0316 family)